jgi:hypothetical protein
MVWLYPDHHLGFCHNALRQFILRKRADQDDGLVQFWPFLGNSAHPERVSMGG